MEDLFHTPKAKPRQRWHVMVALERNNESGEGIQDYSAGTFDTAQQAVQWIFDHHPNDGRARWAEEHPTWDGVIDGLHKSEAAARRTRWAVIALCAIIAAGTLWLLWSS